MNLYCIYHSTDHYRDQDNYGASRDGEPCLGVAREGEDKDAFINRLIEEHLDIRYITPDTNEYTSFHIDYLFYSENVEEDIDAEKYDAYLKKIEKAKEIKARADEERAKQRQEIRRREYEYLKKELGL